MQSNISLSITWFTIRRNKCIHRLCIFQNVRQNNKGYTQVKGPYVTALSAFLTSCKNTTKVDTKQHCTREPQTEATRHVHWRWVMFLLTHALSHLAQWTISSVPVAKHLLWGRKKSFLYLYLLSEKSVVTMSDLLPCCHGNTQTDQRQWWGLKTKFVIDK